MSERPISHSFFGPEGTVLEFTTNREQHDAIMAALNGAGPAYTFTLPDGTAVEFGCDPQGVAEAWGEVPVIDSWDAEDDLGEPIDVPLEKFLTMSDEELDRLFDETAGEPASVTIEGHFD